MRSRITTWAMLGLTLLLTSCASLLGPRDVELPIAKLQQAMDRKFPFNNRYLEIFDIYVSNPRLTLQPDTNRVVTTMDASISPPFLKQAWRGSFTLSAVVQLDPARRAVLLVDPRMDDIVLDGVDPGTTRRIAKIGGMLAEEILRKSPLYTFGPDDFRYGGSSFVPTRIVTRSSGLVVTFEPAK